LGGHFRGEPQLQNALKKSTYWPEKSDGNSIRGGDIAGWKRKVKTSRVLHGRKGRMKPLSTGMEGRKPRLAVQEETEKGGR